VAVSLELVEEPAAPERTLDVARLARAARFAEFDAQSAALVERASSAA
jgi:hypothetical protein